MIPSLGSLAMILSEHVATHLDDADPGQWLFTVDDEPMYDNAITWRWRATRNAANLPHVRLHDYADLRVMPTSAAICCSAWRSDCCRSA